MNPLESAGDATSENITRAVQGNRDALSTLLASYGPVVERGLQIGRQWRHAIDAADVMQVTYLEAFLEISNFRPESAGSFEAWLRRIAQNNLRDAIRGLERLKQLPPSRRIHASAHADGAGEAFYERIAATSSTPSRAAGRQDVRRLVEAALDKLPSDYAQIIRLYDIEGRPIAEVSEAMKRSPGAVHMMRARAHDRLALLLQSASL